MFLDLEKISREFNITNCWICGDTSMAEIWPWEGIPLSTANVLKIVGKETSGVDQRPEEEIWDLRSEVFGEECIWRKGPRYKSYVGEIPCKRYYVTNETHQWRIRDPPMRYWTRH